MADIGPVAPEGQVRTGSLFQDERRSEIVKRVLERGRVDVGELAEEFGVTGETIRRDLTELQRERLVRRVHGGAVPWRGSVIVPRLEVREGHNVAEKRRIAKAALAEVPQTGSIIIDSGSTALQLADVLDREREIVVVTNQMSIVRSLATTERPDIIVLGGALRRRTMAFVDETGVEALRDMSVDVAFIGCDGMSPAHGFTTPSREEVGPTGGHDVRPLQDRERAALPFRRCEAGRCRLHRRGHGPGRGRVARGAWAQGRTRLMHDAR
jgi:DeoR family fructose operon transcriptional repressor